MVQAHPRRFTWEGSDGVVSRLNGKDAQGFQDVLLKVARRLSDVSRRTEFDSRQNY